MTNTATVTKCALAALVIAAASVAAEAAPKKPAARDLRKEVNTEIGALQKNKRVTYKEIVLRLEEIRNGADAATNAAFRVWLDEKIVDFCKMPGWTALKRFDKPWATAYIPGVCRREIEAADCPNANKLGFYRSLAQWQAGEKDDAGALKTARAAMALPGLNPGEVNVARTILIAAHNWAGRYDDAMREVRELQKADPLWAARLGGDMAFDNGREDEAQALWTAAKKPYDELMWYVERDAASKRDEALAFVASTNNSESARRDVFYNYFVDDKTEMGDRARKAAADLDFSKAGGWTVNRRINTVYACADWPFLVKLYDTLPNFFWFGGVGQTRALLFSLIAVGRGGEVAALADAYVAKDAAAKRPRLTDMDKLKFELLKTLAANKDALAVVNAAKLDAKDHATAVKTIAQWALNLQRTEECERYSAAYVKLFKPAPERRYAMKFFATPVASIDAWRQVYGSLEKSLVDIKMCGDLDRLDTDVATGREASETTEKDSKTARMEVSALCDVEGVRVFLRVQDKNARSVEKGFAGGLGTEMYFAPGAGEPYVCFGSSPKAGLNFVFHTAYTSAESKRMDFEDLKSKYAIREETAFTDDDYVLMLTFPWNAFYQKLPVKAGAEWRFECLSGGYSWGGSQGVHEASSWGRLVFNLKPEEIAAIRRRLVYDTYKSWNRAERGTLPLFDKWADPVLGDPDFYEQCLKPLEAELKAEAAKVSETMTDAEVNEVYEKGAVRWIGLPYEIDALRRTYLLDKFTK